MQRNPEAKPIWTIKELWSNLADSEVSRQPDSGAVCFLIDLEVPDHLQSSQLETVAEAIQYHRHLSNRRLD